MIVGRKIRIYPTAGQSAALNQWIGCQRVIRNAKVEETRYRNWLRRYSKFSSRPGDESGGFSFDQAYSHFISDQNAWLREVPCQILRNGAYRAKEAFSRYYARKAKRPVHHSKQPTESVLITSELFRLFIPPTVAEPKWVLHLGSKSEPLGLIRWKAHREFQVPSMITITRQGDGAWFVSFNFDDGQSIPTNKELLAQLAFTPKENLLAFDLGIAHPLYDSRGQSYDLPAQLKRRISHLERRNGYYQQKLARQVKGSCNRQKSKKILARISKQKTNLLTNWAHQTTHRICSSHHQVIVMEDTRLANMTRAPKPKPSDVERPDGLVTYAPNGANAKAGLNKALLKLGLSRIKTFTQYKARRAVKAFLCSPAPFPLKNATSVVPLVRTIVRRKPSFTARLAEPRPTLTTTPAWCIKLVASSSSNPIVPTESRDVNRLLPCASSGSGSRLLLS